MTAIKCIPPRQFAREDALALAGELVSGIRERAERCMFERIVPEETIQELKDSGLIRLMQPRRYGGYELGRDVVCEVIKLFAPVCGSQAWVYHVYADHAWMLGTFSKKVQDDVWADDKDTLISSSFAPVARVQPSKGGFVCSGRHGFSSGIDYAHWVVCGGMVEGSGEVIHFLVPKGEGTVIDDWHVNGLEGTGSKSFQINEIFVPEHRTMKFSLALAGKGLGTETNIAPLYKAPRYGYTSAGFAALVTGMAQGLLEDWLAFTARRGGPKGAAQKEGVQILAGQAASEINAAEMLYLTTARDATRRLDGGEDLAAGGNHQIRCNFAFAVQLVLAATVRIYHASGASMVYRGNSMERQYRNIMAGVQHMSTDWPSGAAGYGAQLLKQHGANL